MKVTIEVTQEDIRNGVVRRCYWCPVSLALARRFPESTFKGGSIRARADGTEMAVFPWGVKAIATTPKKVHDFMKSFDHGVPVHPFTFEADFV